jgi:hypothetical protein
MSWLFVISSFEKYLLGYSPILKNRIATIILLLSCLSSLHILDIVLFLDIKFSMHYNNYYHAVIYKPQSINNFLGT